MDRKCITGDGLYCGVPEPDLSLDRLPFEISLIVATIPICGPMRNHGNEAQLRYFCHSSVSNSSVIGEGVGDDLEQVIIQCFTSSMPNGTRLIQYHRFSIYIYLRCQFKRYAKVVLLFYNF